MTHPLLDELLAGISPGVPPAPCVVLVPMPLGNRGDITLRALALLRQAHVIAAEDTRHSGVLLRQWGVTAPLVALHQHNEHEQAPRLLASAQAQGHLLAVVTDAGTPGLSDPGYRIVQAALAADVPVTALPGPVAAITALVASGLPADRFAFEGFLPVKKGRTRRLQALTQEPRTLVLYESPHRLPRTLADLVTHLGPDRQAVVARELTKLHEQYHRGTLQELMEHFTTHAPKGELVLMVAPPGSNMAEYYAAED